MNDDVQRKKGTHGGAGRGQGRKPSGKPHKIPVGVKVEIVIKEHLKELSKTSGHSQSAIVEWLIGKTHNVPKKI